MSQDDETFELAASGRPDYVPVVVAKSMEQAEKYRELLDEHDIPAITDPDYEGDDAARKGRRGRVTRGVPVLVPEALLDEASEIIADREDLDEFAPPAEHVEDEEEEEEGEEIGAEDDEEVELEEEEELVEDELEGELDANIDLEDEEDEEEDDEK